MSLRDSTRDDGRQGERISGIWQRTPVSSWSMVAQREGKIESFVSAVAAARTGNTKYGRHLVFSFGANEPSKSTSSMGSRGFFASPEGELWNKHPV